jgi:hypothetical protein
VGEEMTLEQQQAIAIATARLRLQQQATPEQTAERNRLLAMPYSELVEGLGPIEAEQPAGRGPVARRVVGAVKGAIVDPIEAGIQLFGGAEGRRNVAEREASYQQMRKEIGESGFEGSRLLGAVASPVNIIPALGTARYVASAGGGLARQAGAAGVVASLTQPVSNAPEDLSSFLAEKVEQLGAGAVLGVLTQGGISLASKTGSFLKDLANPLTKKGRENILRERLKELSGPELDKVVEAAKNIDELVPGSKPTLAQAVSDLPTATGLSSFEQKIASVPGVSPLFAQRSAQQEVARETLIRNFAKTPEQLKLAELARSLDADRNYGLAFSYSVTANPKLAKIATNPYFQDAMPDAIKLAEAKGISAKTDLTEFLQGVKISLDKQLSRTGDAALAKAEKAQVARVKSELLQWLKAKNPLFEKARAQFAEASSPINEMQVGQYLLGKLRTPLDQERAGAFGLAVKDAASTIKRSTGETRFDNLGQIINKQAEKDVNSVLADLIRTQKAVASGKKTSLGSLVIDESTGIGNFLSRPVMLTNNLLKLLKKDIIPEINQQAAELMLNPQDFAIFMSSIPKSKVKSIVNALYPKLTPENKKLLNTILGIEAGVELQNEPE